MASPPPPPANSRFRISREAHSECFTPQRWTMRACKGERRISDQRNEARYLTDYSALCSGREYARGCVNSPPMSEAARGQGACAESRNLGPIVLRNSVLWFQCRRRQALWTVLISLESLRDGTKKLGRAPGESSRRDEKVKKRWETWSKIRPVSVVLHVSSRLD